MVALNGVRLVAFQFSFSNPNIVPHSLKQLERKGETLEEQNERKAREGSGSMIIKPTENCSLVQFLDNLKGAGYEMVDAFYQSRIDPKDPRGRRMYHMMRFLFVRHEDVDISDEFKKVRNVIGAELREICTQALWRVRAFRNPFFKGGEEISGQRALSVNLEARKPLFYPDGQPITVWQKDEKGYRVGDKPQAIKPDYCLHIKDDAVQLLAV